MSTQSKSLHTSEAIIDFYIKHLENFGASSQGVGWKNDHAQNIRFHQLSKILTKNEGFSINDLGCGAGKYFEYLTSNGFTPSLYNGYDILEEMISAATQSLLKVQEITLTKITFAEEMQVADYTVSSGIFNVKYQAADADWLQSVISTLEAMNEKSSLGFAFNMLTKYSDTEFMQAYLYYADPLFFFDYCKRNFSKNIALLHDYDQHDFTILVRKRNI